MLLSWSNKQTENDVLAKILSVRADRHQICKNDHQIFKKMSFFFEIGVTAGVRHGFETDCRRSLIDGFGIGVEKRI